MATSGIVGGSSIDVQGLVSQLVAAERAPLDAQLARANSKVTTQISATSTLLGALSSFQSSLSGLRTTTVFSGRAASTTDTTIATASASSSAVPGRYDIEVQQLASSHQISSVAFPDGSSSVLGSGQLTISLGSSSFSVTIGGDANTLADVRNAINSASDNPGVTATIINASDGAHLVLTSTKTGAAHTIQVTATGDLGQLEYTADNQANYTQLRAAQDAIVRVAGYETTSPNNVVEGVIEGVSINLLKAQPDTTVSIDVSYDKTAAKQKINQFVAAYNQLRSVLTSLGGYNAATQTAGPMLGDSLLSGIDAEIRRTLSAPVEAAGGGAVQTLADIGITTQADGTLKVDDVRLSRMLEDHFDAISRLFGTEGTGVAARLHKQIEDRLADGAALDVRTESLQAQKRALELKAAANEARIDMVRQAYLRQFTALDTLLSSLSSTSAYLSQQIDSLPKWSKD
jgi:flagellar hook-associated protein 2